MAIDTAAAYKAWSGSSVSHDDATVAIAAVQAGIERFCGRDAGGFELDAERVEIVDGPGVAEIWLKHWPVNSVASVERRTAKSTWTTVDEATYDVTARGKLYRLRGDDWGWTPRSRLSPRGAVWADHPMGYRVTYSGGAEDMEATFPDLLMVAREMVSEVLRRRDSEFDSMLQSEGMGGYNWTRAAGEALTEERRARLEPFRAGQI